MSREYGYEDDYDDRPRRAHPGGRGAGAWLVIGLVVGVLVCAGVVVIPLLVLPALQKVRGASARASDMNNFRQVGLGMHNHHEVKTDFPAADGGLSFRVHLLPFVEQAPLYNRFDPNVSWDDPRNRPLGDTRVPVYASALDDKEFNVNLTRVRVYVGPDTLFPPGERPLRLPEITDGAANTFLAVEATEQVLWSRPRELPHVPGGVRPTLGYPERPGFIALMADGSARFVGQPVHQAAVDAAVTPNGGEGPPGF